MASLSNINGLFDVHSTGAILFSTSHGTSGQILKSNGNAAPTWVTVADIIGGPYLPLSGGTLTGATSTDTGINFTVGGNLFVTGTSTLTGALGLPGTAAQYVTGTGALATFPAIPQGDITGLTAGTGITIADATGPVPTITNSAPNIVQTSVTGNAGTATALQTARTINAVSFNGTANIMVPSIYDGNYRRITNPGGAEYVTTASSVTGTIEIIMPITSWTGMFSFTVEVYEYITNRSFTLKVGGHLSSTTWYNEFAYLVGNPGTNLAYTIRFGRNAAGKAVVYVGELAETWSYPQAWVTDICWGYSGGGLTLTTGWDINFRTAAFEGVTRTQTAVQVGYQQTGNIANSVVLRDGSGGFSAGAISGTTFNGLAINTTGTNNVANQIVRTDVNGYANFGWINTISGNHTGTITRITASGDAYLRYVTPAQFRVGVTDGYYAPIGTVSGVTSVATGNGLTGGTITSTGTLSMSGSYTGTFTATSLASDSFLNNAGNLLFSAGNTTTGASRSLNLRTSGTTGDPSSSDDSNSTGITWGQRTDSNPYYIIYPNLENWSSSGNYSKLTLAWHTGIKIGAASGYGGTRFYNNSPDIAGAAVIMNVGVGNDNIGVVNALTVGTTINAGGVVTAAGGNSTQWNSAYANQGNYLPLAGGTMTGNIGRSASNVGFQVGTYNNVGPNSTHTNPIYTIGSSYNPALTTLSNMYGVGYSNVGASFISFTGASDWGFYVAAVGVARVWLDGNNGAVSTAGSMYAAAYYDTNTAYYGDFAGSSQFNVITTNGNVFNGNTTVSSNNYITFGPNTTWGSSLRVGGNGYTATGTEMASIATTDGNIHLDAANSSNAIYLNYYAGTGGTYFGTGASGYAARVYSSGNAHFPIYYDSNNTAYFGDFGGTYSNITKLKINGNWGGASGVSPDDAQFQIRGTYPSMTFRSTQSNNMWLRHMDGAGDIQHYYAPATDSTAWSIKHTMQTDGTFFSSASHKAPIFYDSANTGYYLDPASTSNLNALTLVGTLSGQNGYFNQDLAVGFNSGAIGGKVNIQINSANGIGIKNNLNGRSGAQGLLQYTSASYASGGYNMIFQAAPPSGSDVNMLLCYLNGNIVNRFNSYGQYSDRKLKENIVDTTPKLEDVKKIRIRNFNFKDDPYKQIGVIAQEFEEVFPGLVEDKEVPDQDETVKTVKYSVLVPILVKAMQEQQVIIDDLKLRIEKLEL